MKNNRLFSVIIGFFILLWGVSLLLSNFIQFDIYFDQWRPFGLSIVLIGFGTFFLSKRKRYIGLSLLFWGLFQAGFIILAMISPLKYSGPSVILPALVIAAGFYLMTQPTHKRSFPSDTASQSEFNEQYNQYTNQDDSQKKYSGNVNNGEDKLQVSDLFSSRTQYFTTQNFQGGFINSRFSDTGINLSAASTTLSEINVDVIGSFSNIQILVPKTWNIELLPNQGILATTSKNGSFVASENAPTIRISPNITLGNIEVVQY